MADWARISYVWPSATFGTPPFQTGMWFLAPDGASEEAFNGLVSIGADAYDSHCHGLQFSALGAGFASGTFVTDDAVFEDTAPISAPTAGDGIRGPGFSFNLVLQ